MSFQNFKSDSFCVGGRHRSSTKTFMVIQLLKVLKYFFGYCSICNRQKSMTVSDNTKIGEGLQDFSKEPSKKRPNISKEMAKNVLENPTRALDFTVNVATAAASRNPKSVMSTLLEVITFCNTGE